MYLIFDVGASHTRIAVSNDGVSFDILERYNTDRSRVGLEIFVDKITTYVRKQPVISIAGGIAGQIDPASGVLRQATNLPEWVGEPVAERLKRSAGVPVIIENDAALGGLGEACRGLGAGLPVVAYLTISTGVNGVRIENGKIAPTSRGFELGQELVADSSGELVSWESLIGGAAMAQRYHRSPKAIKDDEVWQRTAKYLAVGLYNLLLAWSPDIVLLNGPMVKDIPLATVRSELERLGEPLGVWPPIKRAKLGDEAGLYGALVRLSQADVRRAA